jgi:hypothetical protein
LNHRWPTQILTAFDLTVPVFVNFTYPFQFPRNMA